MQVDGHAVSNVGVGLAADSIYSARHHALQANRHYALPDRHMPWKIQSGTLVSSGQILAHSILSQLSHNMISLLLFFTFLSLSQLQAVEVSTSNKKLKTKAGLHLAVAGLQLINAAACAPHSG